MLTSSRRSVLVLVVVACLTWLGNGSVVGVMSWTAPALGIAGWVQVRARRGDAATRARCRYAAVPIGLLALVPVALIIPLRGTDRVLVLTALLVAAALTQARSLTHERLITALHGPEKDVLREVE